MHDVFDHKYTTVDEAKNGMEKIEAFLTGQKYSEPEVTTIRLICENIFYSMEKKDKLAKLTETDGFLRDIVSDADKLDAIGYAGIERCRDFSRHIAPNADAVELERMVVEHMHDKLLKLNEHYIRTDAGKGTSTSSIDFTCVILFKLEIGRALHEEMLQYLKRE